MNTTNNGIVSMAKWSFAIWRKAQQEVRWHARRLDRDVSLECVVRRPICMFLVDDKHCIERLGQERSSKESAMEMEERLSRVASAVSSWGFPLLHHHPRRLLLLLRLLLLPLPLLRRIHWHEGKQSPALVPSLVGGFSPPSIQHWDVFSLDVFFEERRERWEERTNESKDITEHLRRSSMCNHNRDNRSIEQVRLVLDWNCHDWSIHSLSNLFHPFESTSIHLLRHSCRRRSVECNRWNCYCTDDVFGECETNNHLDEEEEEELEDPPTFSSSSHPDICRDDCRADIDSSYLECERWCATWNVRYRRSWNHNTDSQSSCRRKEPGWSLGLATAKAQETDPLEATILSFDLPRKCSSTFLRIYADRFSGIQRFARLSIGQCSQHWEDRRWIGSGQIDLMLSFGMSHQLNQVRISHLTRWTSDLTTRLQGRISFIVFIGMFSVLTIEEQLSGKRRWSTFQTFHSIGMF